MIYVLVILAFGTNEVHSHHINFGSSQECEAARRAVLDSVAKWRSSPALSCVASTARPGG